MTELRDVVWWFLPSRPDRRRVTTPDVIAVNVGATVAQVAEALSVLESSGRIVRDSKVGERIGWHRVTPVALFDLPTQQPNLFDGVA